MVNDYHVTDFQIFRRSTLNPNRHVLDTLELNNWLKCMRLLNEYIFKNWSKTSGLSYGDSQSIIQAEQKLAKYQEVFESLQVNFRFHNFPNFEKFSIFVLC